jgi:hypothetical protein
VVNFSRLRFDHDALRGALDCARSTPMVMIEACYRGRMHRSRVSTILIDVPGSEKAAATRFWSAALGTTARPVPGEEQFTNLPGVLPGLVLSLHSVDDQPRYHVDIETDDVGAETARLVALGAVQIGQWLDCHTLRAPGGHLLCVIPLHSDPEEFQRATRIWD